MRWMDYWKWDTIIISVKSLVSGQSDWVTGRCGWEGGLLTLQICSLRVLSVRYTHTHLFSDLCI